MKTLPNGIKIFNATPHVIRFWHSDWPEPVEVETDTIVSATVKEERIIPDMAYQHLNSAVEFVRTNFVGSDEARAIIADALRKADLVVGSIIAAQAYPGDIVAMVPCEGYERVPPNEKRMRPDKFTIF